MKASLALMAATALGTAALALSPAIPAGPTVGDTAPEFGSSDTTWFNHLGQNPDLASLRGKAVLIEFWATW